MDGKGGGGRAESRGQMGNCSPDVMYERRIQQKENPFLCYSCHNSYLVSLCLLSPSQRLELVLSRTAPLIDLTYIMSYRIDPFVIRLDRGGLHNIYFLSFL